MTKLKIKSTSMKRTIEEGERFAAGLKPGDVVVLSGELGSGKTVFTKGIAKGLNVIEWKNVNSPTFVLLNIYKGKNTLFHFDFYRLVNTSELDVIGFYEFMNGDGITVIEWGEKFKEIFPERTKWINIKYINKNERLITIESRSELTC